MIKHEPEPGNALVNLVPTYGDVPVPPKSYDSLTAGEILAVHPNDKDKQYLVGRIGHWAQFKDDVRLEGNIAFVPLKDILGSSYADTANRD